MTFVQDWGAPNNGNASTSEGRTGTETTAGNTLFFDLFVRTTEELIVEVTDSAGNTGWELIHSYHVGSTNLYSFICRNAAAVTSVSAAFTDALGDPLTAGTLGFLSEHANVGALISTSRLEGEAGGGQPPTIALQPGQLYRAIGGRSAATDSWDIASTGVTPIVHDGHKTGQMTITRAHGYTDTAGDVAIGWTQTGGGDSSYSVLAVAYEYDDSGPQPLSAVVAGDETGTVDTPIPVTVTPAGGLPPYTCAWSVVSGSGAFGSTSAGSTTYTPTEPGVHTLRCTVTDDADDSVQDDLTITVTGPEVLHLVSASGLTPVGAATLLEALSDDDYGTYGETGDDLDGTLLGVLPAIETPAGDLEVIVPVSVNLGTATVTASISADGSTWVDADTTMPATTTPTTRTFTWAAAGIYGYDQDDWQAMQVRVTFTAGD